MFKLVIQDDEGKTTVVPLIRDEITIGRKEGNTIRLTERNVSRRHARILRNNNEVQIEDLGSYNGIRVNNARIAERVSLRISDQVQIGDYKLYLKAEGVEQVDDARTVPIERIDVGTEPMAAVTAPIGTPSPMAANGTPQLVGNPNRTMVAVADTDPVGRPVASAAAVAAMSAPTGYGRLVVLSSNFAGTEFELSRPQMIVGRTDENDLVINHRSMSRNHAKIVREPETGRYTISDLQSSNGVRVNGQDYGKVELRRGDVVDLGHVRLRFVEPGEDFVFARDGVITDVPETGGKRGLMIGLAAAVIVLGGGALFMMNRGGGKDDGKGGTKGSGSAVVTNGGGSGSGGSAMAGNGPGSDVVTNQNNPATNPGSDVTSPPGIDAMVAETMIDAAGAVASTNPDDEKARKQTECRGYTTAKKWQDLFNCSQELAKLGGADATVSEFKDRAQREQANDARLGKLETALANKDFGEAHKLLDKIDDDSVYKVDAKNKLAAKERGLVDDFRARGKRLATAGKCKDLEILSKQAAAQSADAGDAVRGIRCTEQPAGDNPNNNKPPEGKGDLPPAGGCDAPGLEAQAMGLLNTGMFAQALTIFEQASKCKPSYKLVKFSYMASCRSQNAGKAKAYFAKLTAPDQSKMIQMCLSEHITP